MIMDIHAMAAMLGGEVAGQTSLLAPGPKHSPADRSLSIKFDPAARDGFIVHSFAGDDFIACRNHVCEAFGISSRRFGAVRSMPPRSRRNNLMLSAPDYQMVRADDSIAVALRIWNEARDPRRTVVTKYLAQRGLSIPDHCAESVVRFHPALFYDTQIVGGMVTLFRDIETNAPCGIQRTFLDGDGRKKARRMLGRAKMAAIKLVNDEDITLGLTVGEGFETSLAGLQTGFKPVWALGSAGAIAGFPVLSGVEALTILCEVGDGGVNSRASHSCISRWMAAGQEAFVVTPLVGEDLNDAWREAAR